MRVSDALPAAYGVDMLCAADAAGGGWGHVDTSPLSKAKGYIPIPVSPRKKVEGAEHRTSYSRGNRSRVSRPPPPAGGGTTLYCRDRNRPRGRRSGAGRHK